MDGYICFLITVLHNESVLKVALKLDKNKEDISDYVLKFPLEPKSKKVLHSFLPSHLRVCGPIIDVENLFDVHIA